MTSLSMGSACCTDDHTARTRSDVAYAGVLCLEAERWNWTMARCRADGCRADGAGGVRQRFANGRQIAVLARAGLLGAGLAPRRGPRPHRAARRRPAHRFRGRPLVAVAAGRRTAALR